MSLLATLGTIGSIVGGVGSVLGSLFGGKKDDGSDNSWSKIGSAGSTLSGLGSTLMAGQSILSGIKGAEEQSALSRGVFDYQKELQNRIFEREDNAVQRRALDLEAAGLSKTLAAGSAAGAGSVVSTNVPQSSEMLKSQALVNGINSMLSIAQSKANIALTNAQASKVSAESREIEHNLGWYSGSGLPTGVKEGILFTVGGLSNLLGVSNQEIASAVYSGLSTVASKFGIELPSLKTALDSVSSDSESPSTSSSFKFFGDSKISSGSNSSKYYHPDYTLVPLKFSLASLLEKLIIRNGFSVEKASDVVSDIFTGDQVTENLGLTPVSKSWKDYVNSFKYHLYEALRSVNSKFFGGK